MKKKLLHFLGQMVPVMLGVYLAFAISNWNDGLKRKEEYRTLKANLIAEFRANSDKIKNVIPYHAMLVDSTRFQLQKTDGSEISVAFFSGLKPQALSKSAYETGVQTGVLSDFDINNIQKINDIYAFQQQYKELSSIILNALISYNINHDRPEDKKLLEILDFNMNDIYFMEKRLLTNYEQVIQKLEE